MTELKPWVSNPDPASPYPVTFAQGAVTHPERGAEVSSPTPGGYENTVATKTPGAGELKPLAGGTPMPISTKSSAKPQTGQTPTGPIPAQPGRRGTGRGIPNTKRTVL